MVFKARHLTLSLVLLTSLGCSEKKNSSEQTSAEKANPIFTKITSNQSGVTFKNDITENVANLENLFNYDYFYNGAGVGLIDFDNDGLLDIYFCGNQVENKLFKNLGNFKFQDVSQKAGINQNKTWSNGVSIADVNNDGWSDIYISQGGPLERTKRKNLLFINQQDGTFKELAEDLGLGDMGISTQSVFFDFDNDGDLDCFVMNENEFYGVDPINLYKLIDESDENRYFNSSHFYKNENGRFTDITLEAGLERPIFGLGIAVTDINNDHLLDFYVASDYYIPDAFFVNNGDGSFSDRIKEYTQHVSYYGMGVDIADINNDNLQDIFVLDMAANDHVRSKTLMASMNTSRFDYLVNKADFHHQYMYNSLQLNQGGDRFSNIAQLSAVANTDWSWSVLMADYDLDSDKDIYVTNGYRRYALDNDLQQKVYRAKVKYKGNVPLDVKKNLYESMPSEKLPNILFENSGGLQFSNEAKNWGLDDYSFSNGAALGDLDNDGDLDLVVNNMDEEAFLYKNSSIEDKKGNYLKVKPKGKTSESFAKVSIFYENKSQVIEVRSVRGYRSSQENIAHFGLGEHTTIDSVEIKWLNGHIQKKFNVASNQTIEFSEEDATEKTRELRSSPLFEKVNPKLVGLDFSHKENSYDDFEKEILLPYRQSTAGPHISKGDVNGDGLEDLFIGGATGQSGALFLQNKAGKFSNKVVEAFNTDSAYEDMQSIFFDFDDDKDLDLFIVSGGNEFSNYSSLYSDRLYINDGKANFQRASIDALNSNAKSGKSVSIIDYDQDGDKDILVGNRIVPQNYPNFAPSTIWQNENGQLTDVTKSIAPDLLNFGIINDIITTDFDSDGWDDFIAVGEWSEIGFFRNQKGKFSKVDTQNGLANTKGWWFSIRETDVNNDGLPDYLLGNVGLNIKFRASNKKPFKVFATDFDDNGTQDIVLSKQYNGEYVPVRGRECSSQQMPFIQQKFETYSDFANAKLLDIYGDKLEYAYEGEVNEFKSLLLLNKGDGQFEKKALPIEAQLFPVLSIVFKDFNHDGYEDALLGGNIYETEVETPRLDAFSGLILLSNGKDNYKTMPWEKSGVLLDGNIKDLTLLPTQENTLLLATRNDDSLEVHYLKK